LIDGAPGVPPGPQPPYLVVRESAAFWVETRPFGESAATVQAFEEGCYRGAWAYDMSGRMWPVVAAALARRASLFDRWFAWRRVPVRLEFGEPSLVGLPEIVARLETVLRSGSEFTASLSSPIEVVLGRLRGARTLEEVVLVARDSGK
jgi:hypothetical protein